MLAKYNNLILKKSKKLPAELYVTSLEGTNFKHFHNELEITILLEGEITIDKGNKKYHLKENDLLIINSRELHSIENYKDNIVLVLRLDLKDYIKKYPVLNKIKFYMSEEDVRLGTKTDVLRYEISHMVLNILNKDEDEEDLKSRIDIILKYIINNCDNIGLEKIRDEDLYRLERILSYVVDNLDKDIKLSDIAKSEHLSEHYVSHFVKKNLGMPLTEFVNNIKLEKFVNLLLTTDENITDLSFKAGFSGTSYMNKIFKEKFNTSPLKYRKANKVEEASIDKVDNIKNNMIQMEKIMRKLYFYSDININRFDLDFAKDIFLSQSDIFLDISNFKSKSYDKYWQKVLNLGETEKLLTIDIQKQIKEIQKDIGFKYIRIGDLFKAGTGVFSKGHSLNIEEVTFNWTYLDEIMDFLKKVNLRPYIEIGYRKQDIIDFYDYDKEIEFDKYDKKYVVFWQKLMKEFIRHFINRMGIDYVKTWYFEVSNSEDLVLNLDNYGYAYSLIQDLFKDIGEDFKLGCPIISFGGNYKEVKVNKFIDMALENKWEIDFFTIHLYPVGSSVTEEDYILNYDLDDNKNINEGIMKIKKNLKDRFGDQIEFHITDWSQDYPFSQLIQDTSLASTYLLDSYKNTLYTGVDSASFWTISDTVEGAKKKEYPFYGGRGLMNKNGIKKPNYFLYQFLSKFGECLIGTGDDYLIAERTNEIHILAYQFVGLKDEFIGKEIDYDNIFYCSQEVKQKSVSIFIDNIKGKYKVLKYNLNRENGSSFYNWILLGKPKTLSSEEKDYLIGISRPTMTTSIKKLVGSYKTEVIIPPHGIVYIVLKKIF